MKTYVSLLVLPEVGLRKEENDRYGGPKEILVEAW